MKIDKTTWLRMVVNSSEIKQHKQARLVFIDEEKSK